MFSAAAPLAVTADQKRELELLVRNGNSPQKVALRCKILLLANQGVANSTIADELKISRPTVLALRAAFANEGLKAVTGIRRRKRSPKVLTPELEQRILDTTLKTRPGDGSTHWSVRTLASTPTDIQDNRSPRLATPRCAAAPCRTLQTVQRSAV